MSRSDEIKVLSKDKHVITHPDGIASVMSLHRAGVKSAVKIPGCELWIKYIRDNKPNVYVLGAREDVLDITIQKLTGEGISVVGSHNGFFDVKQKEDILDELVASCADVVVLALGQPKQEKIAHEFLRTHKAIYFCVGGSLDVYSGSVNRAPRLFIKLGLEWLYRLGKQPNRILRQSAIPRFLFQFVLNRDFGRASRE
jgi:exopolysaccharide biosynthesis WecB/TagA/CpsF family protein